jgi:TetR/AcrR family transcriptional regulator, transcriptional repressor for nem operon
MMNVIECSGGGSVARYSSDHKDRTRARVVELAADQIRSGGLESLGVASVMAEAGLTHGGFYAHFRSRDALVAAAVETLFAAAVEAVDHFSEKYGTGALDRYVDFYLSPRHRDEERLGCPVPALAGEVRHASTEVRAAFDAGLDRLAERIGAMMPTGGKKAALRLLGEMAGVLSLSRTISDVRRSNDLLSAARKELLAG